MAQGGPRPWLRNNSKDLASFTSLYGMSVDYDVIVVGAGHAGTEASVMAARLGAKSLLLTSNLDTIGAHAVVLTAGTFLRGRIHLGTDTQIPAGRAGDQPAVDIAQHVEALGFTVSRFKTGTPPRVDGRTVDWSRVERQDGDATAYRFSFYERVERPRQVPCWITWAGEEVKDIIRRHRKESALYGGAIASRGPRYCPSVE